MTSPAVPAGERFAFRFTSRYRNAARLFGITEARAWVSVDAQRFEARYGRWHVATPIANIASVALTGPYRFVKTAGPPRLGVTDRGLTFASNGDRGVELQFREPVRVIGPLRHPELTITVADPDGLAVALERLIA